MLQTKSLKERQASLHRLRHADRQANPTLFLQPGPPSLCALLGVRARSSPPDSRSRRIPVHVVTRTERRERSGVPPWGQILQATWCPRTACLEATHVNNSLSFFSSGLSGLSRSPGLLDPMCYGALRGRDKNALPLFLSFARARARARLSLSLSLFLRGLSAAQSWSNTRPDEPCPLPGKSQHIHNIWKPRAVRASSIVCFASCSSGQAGLRLKASSSLPASRKSSGPRPDELLLQAGLIEQCPAQTTSVGPCFHCFGKEHGAGPIVQVAQTGSRGFLAKACISGPCCRSVQPTWTAS